MAHKTFAEKLKQANAKRLPSGELYSQATLDQWAAALAVHHARGVEIRRKGYASSRSEMEWNIQDGDYRYNLGVINEDRRAKGLPLIEFE